MLDFLKRNFPVLIIGLIIVVIFLVIITYGEKRSQTSILPSLIKVEREEDKLLQVDRTQEYAENPEARPKLDIEGKEEFIGTEVGGYLITEDGTLKTEEEIYEEDFQKRVEYYKEALVPDTDEEIDEIYPTLNIIFTSDGFVPIKKNIANGQKIKWINGTEETITIKQNTEKFKDDFWEEGITLTPGESFEYRIRQSGYWSFREITTNSFGSIFGTAARRT